DGQHFILDYAAGDDNEVRLTKNTSATITDVDITPEVNEGDVVTFRAGLSDPDPVGNWSVTLDWGDGSPPETIHPGLAPFTLTHRYLDDRPSGTSSDQYTITFSWTDGGGVIKSSTAQVTVHNVAPLVDAGGDETLHQNNVLERTGSVFDPGRD